MPKNKIPEVKISNLNTLSELKAAKLELKAAVNSYEKKAKNNIIEPLEIGTTIWSFLPGRKNSNGLVDTAFDLFFGNKKSKKNKVANTLKTNVSNNSTSKLNIVDISKNKTFGKKVMASLIRWGLFEVGVWGVKKGIQKIKKK